MTTACAARPPAILLLGPTASGKTAAALKLAARFPLEIISADSALVYRGMDIGSAKPDAAERAQCPHHLIDILDPTESWSAARFIDSASALMQQISARQRIPLITGGTMLYFHALVSGLSDLPPANPALRAQINHDAARHGWPHLHRQLAAHDPQAAADLAPNDAQRIQRALEIVLTSGQSLAANHAKKIPPAHGHRLLALALDASDQTQRRQLHQRIGQRLDTMFAHGFIEELQQLRQRFPALSREHTAMRCVGYRQLWQYLDGQLPRAELHPRCAAATRQLAKRQLTWQRQFAENWPALHRFSYLDNKLEHKLHTAVSAFLHSPS